MLQRHRDFRKIITSRDKFRNAVSFCSLRLLASGFRVPRRSVQVRKHSAAAAAAAASASSTCTAECTLLFALTLACTRSLCATRAAPAARGHPAEPPTLDSSRSFRRLFPKCCRFHDKKRRCWTAARGHRVSSDVFVAPRESPRSFLILFSRRKRSWTVAREAGCAAGTHAHLVAGRSAVAELTDAFR